MNKDSLYNFITYLQYGTKLQIGVTFLDDNGSEKCILPSECTFRSSRICKEFKNSEGGLEKCFKCRDSAFHKVLRTKEPFGGICVNGVYDYSHPVVIDGNVICIIFVGNILVEGNGEAKLIENLGNKDFLIDTMEKNFDIDNCDIIASLVETYIRFILKDVPMSYTKNFNPLMENIKNYIESNLEYDIKISQISKRFQYNEQYLGRLFKKEMKISFNQYINQQRIERAARLLAETNEPIIAIALSVGFSNVTYFNRLFKKRFNITPSEFRKTKSAQ
ncbi:MAG: helix-turn-helix domain-containing protein [Clostridia bacterium]|nr:helix-turn-helix domain-containing protein [Clostridia bacterium]